MKTFEAGEPVKAGTYMNTSTGQFFSFQGPEKAILPTLPSANYVRVPVAIVFLLGPLLGLAYIIFVPLAGIGTLGILAVRRLKGGTVALTPKQAKQ